MGFTITPSIEYGPSGEEIVSYDSANIQSTAGREYILDHFNKDNSWGEDLYYERPDGTIGHRYADLDGDIYERFESDFVPQIDADEYLRSAEMSSEDISYFKDMVGGESQYQQMIEWASRQTNSEYVAWFDGIMDSNDGEQIEEAIRDLYEAWSTRKYEDDGQDYVQLDTDDEDIDDTEPVSQAFIAEVKAAVGGVNEYQSMVSWAAQALPEHEIDSFDAIMDSGDEDLIAEAVAHLYEMYIENN